MNLGHKVTVALIFFVGFISYLAFMSFQENTDLVAEDYYKQEVEFQQTIDKKKNSLSLSENVKVLKSEKSVIIKFPKEFYSKLVSGTILFLNPVNVKYDISKTFEITNNQLEFPVSDFNKGNYRIKVDWKGDGQEYYFEDFIVM